ncbi:MAG: hypothetical protein M0P31_01610 [Solirubrobacteraceae bacterium]|nr:hypothetical protein [Solirubrobacteraceae bacterium]
MSRRPSRIASLCASLVATLLILTGCGGQAQEVRDGDRYADRVNRVQQRFERDLQAVRKSVAGAEDRADVQRVARRLSQRINAVEQQLGAIEPPEVVADAHRRLVDAFARWRAPVDAFRRALRDRDVDATLQAKATFDTETAAVEERVNDARSRINEGLRKLAD